MDTSPDEVKRVTGSMPKFENSLLFPPIQAADLSAWWHRRFYLKSAKLAWPYPWNEERPLARLHFWFDERDYRNANVPLKLCDSTTETKRLGP